MKVEEIKIVYSKFLLMISKFTNLVLITLVNSMVHLPTFVVKQSLTEKLTLTWLFQFQVKNSPLNFKVTLLVIMLMKLLGVLENFIFLVILVPKTAK